MAVSADLLKSIRNKFSTYTLDQCTYAKADIANTLQYYHNQKDNDYVDKLWAEIDAANERIAYLKANGLKRRLHTREVMDLLEQLQADCTHIGRHDYGLPIYEEGQQTLIATVRDWFNRLPQ